MNEMGLGRGHPYQRNCGCEDELSVRILADDSKLESWQSIFNIIVWSRLEIVGC